MRPAARIQAAIEILEALEQTAKPVDRFLRDYFRARRYAGSGDRAAVAERVFQIFRHRAAFAWRMQAGDARALAMASLLSEGISRADIETLYFLGEGYGPPVLDDRERAAIDGEPREPMSPSVRGEYPEWLAPELARAFGDRLVEECIAFTLRAPIDLRVNTLKANRDDVLVALRTEGYDAAATPYAPHGIRVAGGRSTARLNRHPLFESGAFEFQDEAAQIASALCEAEPGETILDLAAGAGGKSLALAADMKNEGRIVACDVREGALTELAKRAERAGASIVTTAHAGRVPDSAFDAVLVDAPCSGSGTWRRQPELKWRLTSARLAELHTIQRDLLETAARHVRRGGRLIYMTCSILPSENEDRIEEFLKEHPGFAVRKASAVWRACATKAAPGMDRFFHATPLSAGTDGFFTAILERTA